MCRIDECVLCCFSLKEKEFDSDRRRLIHALQTNIQLLTNYELHNYVKVTTYVQSRDWNWAKSFGVPLADVEFGAAYLLGKLDFVQ